MELASKVTPFASGFFLLGPLSVKQEFGDDQASATIALKEVIGLESKIEDLTDVLDVVVRRRNAGLPKKKGT